MHPTIQPAVASDPLTGQPLTPHKAADDTEQIYYEGSPMVRGILGRGIWWCLLGLLIMAVPVAAFFLIHPHAFLSPWWLNLACVVVGVVVFLLPMVKAKTVRYRISNYRIDFERGWFSKDIDTLELWHVEDLKFHQSFIDRILGVGSVTILSHDNTMPKFVLHALPNPRPIFDALKQRVIAVKRQSGVVKIDTGT
jgi:membrane protein YdbS with pleckstrin-like domain